MKKPAVPALSSVQAGYKAGGYSAFHLGKGVKSGMSGSQKREAKSLQILLSLKRVEKHSLLRKDVLKPSAAAAMPEVGEYFCLPNKFAGPSK